MGRSDRNESRTAVPQELVAVAGWAWRLLVLAVAAYAAVWVLSRLAVVVLPIIAALFLSALLRPLARQLDRYTPRLVAAWLTILIAGAVVAGVGYFIGLRAQRQRRSSSISS